MYGYPSPEAFEEAEKGNIKLGGCEIIIDDMEMPDRFCKDCEAEWSVDRLEADDITKVRFKYWSNWGFYAPDSLTEGQWAFEVFPDGTIKYYSYPLQSRRVLDKDKAVADTAMIQKFYEKLLDALKPWSAAYECQVCDGCSYQIDITYCDGRKRTHKGDIGGGTIDKLIMDFIESIPEMKDKLVESEEN